MQTQLLVHRPHERVKVHARLAPQRHRGEERIHQETLAATDATAEIHAARRHRRLQPAAQRRPPRRLKRHELVVQALQPIERRLLRAVEHDPAPLELGREMLAQKPSLRGRRASVPRRSRRPAPAIRAITGSACVCPPPAPPP